MKMIKAIIRPQSADIVCEGLAEAGFVSLTKLHVFGRGKQKGLKVGDIIYDELPKIMIMIVIDDSQLGKVVEIIKLKAHSGNYGDGKIFISPVEDAFTVRTGERGL